MLDDQTLTARRVLRPYHRKLYPEPMRLLVRHADTGPRGPEPDEWRGLTALGHAQAREIASRLGGLPILRILASPTLRCWQTAQPLARDLGLTIELTPHLAADADPARTLDLLRAVETENAVLCTHRETLTAVFGLLAASGYRRFQGLAPMPAAAAWALYGCPDRPVRLHHLCAAA